MPSKLISRLFICGAEAGSEGNILTSEDAIVFEDVKVVTPAGATLVEDLSLRVPRGTNLLVTGPNGSGIVMFCFVLLLFVVFDCLRHHR